MKLLLQAGQFIPAINIPSTLLLITINLGEGNITEAGGNTLGLLPLGKFAKVLRKFDKRVAFGLSQYLDDVTNATKSTNYFREFGSVFNASKAEGLMEDATKIFFNRKGFSIKQYRNWVNAGRPVPGRGGEPPFYSHTILEYDIIRNTPHLLKKTKILSYP
jgi:hypothetical protein